MASEERYAFVLDYNDVQANLIRKYTLLYFLSDGSLEMYDMKSGKKFLKKTVYDQISRKDLFVGSVLMLYSRQMKIVDYGDAYTRNALAVTLERTLGLIKPDSYEHTGQIIDAVYKNDLRIANLRMVHLSPELAEKFYAVHEGKPFFEKLVAHMTSDYTVAMEIIGDNAILRWRELIGPTSTEVARVESPSSLRALFGTDNTKNACHGSDAVETAEQEIEFFFGSNKVHHSAKTKDCTCCVIKPHVLAEGKLGEIIQIIIEEGYEISGLVMCVLEKAQAEEFLEVYKGVLPYYPALVQQLCNGKCVAVEIRAEEVVKSFRELCGPLDPEIARELRPKSLRARFGEDKVKNAVHCTDLEEDGELESQYFFKILEGQAQ